MKSVALTAYSRSLARRSGVKQLRSQGRVPAVIYGGKIQPQNLEVDARAVGDLIHRAASENILVDLNVEGHAASQRLALMQEVQHHPLSGKILHVDFHEVAPDETVTITAPVEAVGEPVGVKTGGGVLEHVLFKLRVRALPKDLPEAIHVDVSHLEIGQAVHLGDIKPPPGVQILGDKHLSVLAVAAPVSEAAEAAAAEAATETAAEPEMLREKKEEGEAAAVAAPAKGAAGAPAKAAAAGAPAKGAEKAPAKGAAPAPEKAGEKPADKKAEKKK